MSQVPQEFQLSKAMQYIQSKGWSFKQSDSERCELETCPLCKKHGFSHFYIICLPGKQDGLWMCQHCGKSGHLNSLREELGDKIHLVESATGEKGALEPMPDVEAMHAALLGDEDVMDYLVNGRGFSKEIIKQQKLGVSKRYFKKLGGDIKSLAYPYLLNGNCVFVHWRTLPPAPKEFNSLKGWDAPLYNEQVLLSNPKDLTFVEGEANTIIALQHGVTGIVGVPGANFKKAMWLEKLDALELDKIFICYDKDKVGQKAAQALASRIGINRCYKIVLPDFDIPSEDGGTKKGKDLNEWFKHGEGTLEKWEQLKKFSPKFDVDGVIGISEGLDNFEAELKGKPGMMPKYLMPWPSLSGLVALEEGDILDIIAYEKIGKTTFGLNLMEYFVNQYEEDGIIICLEMPNDRMLRKWVSHVAQVPDVISTQTEDSIVLKEKMLAGLDVARKKHQDRKGNLYFCYPKGIKTLDEFLKLVEDCIRRYGVRWLMIDNLQLLAGRTPRGSSSRMEHLDRISKSLQGLNKDHNTNMIRIVQPHRGQNDQLCTMNDVDGSASLAKDCDAGISLNRTKKPEMSQSALKAEGQIMSSDASFDRKLLVTVDITRYSAGGQCCLDYVGETSTVREYNAAQIKLDENAKKEKILKGVTGVGETNLSTGAESVSSPEGI